MSQYDKAKSEYLRTKILTASPEELQLMLYDGAIKFTEEARLAISEGRLEEAHAASVRAQNIVLELSSSLDHEAEPELCGKLASLYNFIYRRLIEANLKRDVIPIDDALKILNYQRETWVLVMQKVAQERRDEETPVAVAAGETPAAGEPGVPAEPGMSLSLSA